MNDHRDPPRREEEELVRRAREGSSGSADDDPALRAATRWLDHVDEAVAMTESLRSRADQDTGDLEADRRLRDRVLDSLGRTEARRSARLPWWRVWAPVTVAALLLGLFTLREVERVGPEAPETTPARQRKSAPLQDVAPRLPSPLAPPPESALRSQARHLDETGDSGVQDDRLGASASPSDRAGKRDFEIPASAQVESLLAELGRRPGPNPARVDSIRAALEALRPRLESDSLRLRVDQTLGRKR